MESGSIGGKELIIRESEIIWMATSIGEKMKCFTKKWCSGDLDDDEIENTLKSYKNYINKIYDKLPFVLKILTKNINLHDGIIRKISFIRDQNILILNGVFGDLQIGYFILEIKYINTTKLDLFDLANGQRLEILSDEVELISENYFCHRMLFSTKKDIEIPFKDIQISIQSATKNDYSEARLQLEFL